MNEQILKRLQDCMKLSLGTLDQLEQLQWVIKDILEDLTREIEKTEAIASKVPLEVPQKPS